jgi:hypothetical protein
MRLFAFIVVVAACIIQAAPISTNPVDFAVFETNNVQVKRTPIDSLFSGVSSSPRALIVKDTGSSHKFKEWDIDTFLVWLNDTLGIDSEPHGIDSTYIGYSMGGSLWGQIPLRWSVGDYRLIFTDNSPDRIYDGYSVEFGDSSLLSIESEDGAYLDLYGRNSCCAGTFNLSSNGSGYSYIIAQNLNLFIDTLLTIQSMRTYIGGSYGYSMYFDGASATGAITAYRKTLLLSLPTITSTSFVYAPSGDTIARIRADSLTVKRSATSALSDSTAKNAPHGVTSGRYAVSAGTNQWTTGSLRETSTGNLSIGIDGVANANFYSYKTCTNTNNPYALIGFTYPTVTQNGSYGGIAGEFDIFTNLNGYTDGNAYRALFGGAYHSSVGSIPILYGLDFSYGTTATVNASNVTGRAAGINITPYFGGTGTYAVAADIYIAAPAATGATVANEWCLISAHNAMSRLEGGLQLDNAASRLWLGETQQGSIYHNGSDMLYVNTVGNHWFSGTPVMVGSSSVNTKVDSNSITSRKWMDTPEGGRAIKIVNRTGAASVKGYMVRPSPSYDTSCTLSVVDVPDPIGVVYNSGVANGSEMWVVTNGIADVYFIGSATRGHIARGFVTGDAGYVAGQAMSEAVPAAPFATDKHFYEIGHVIQSRTGAGLARCVLHQN